MSQDAGDDAIISVRDLVAGFDGQTVLNHLDLEVRTGEILGVVGGSGAGKSVLLRSIIGLNRKRSGKIRVLNVDADEANYGDWRSVERRWGVLFQGGALFSSLTARENIQFPMRQFLDLPETVMDDLAMVKLELVGLRPNDANKLPAELSGGMTKRVASPGHWRSIRRSSSSTNRPPASTRSRRAPSTCSSAPCSKLWASRSSWSPTTSTASTPPATGSLRWRTAE